jgi:pyrroline-5-carboxylate reductase
MSSIDQTRIGVIGLGKMGGILVSALLDQGFVSPDQIRATDRPDRPIESLGEEFGISVSSDNRELAEWADLILLAVKPGTVFEVTEAIAPSLNREKLVVSVAASVSTEMIEKALEVEVPVIRAMPNTPCLVGSGMTAVCRGRYADKAQLEMVSEIFSAVGRTVIIDEKHFNAVTGLSASGPAFIYIILESLAEAGVKVGLPRDVATLLAAQTTLGASQVVLETGNHPALLKDVVTTPAGCTIDGILELEEGKLRVTLIKAVVKATERAKELVKMNG